MVKGKRKFEARIINPILNTIKNNLDYLTQPENLPQLAKLGFMYNTLWYGGRICFGYGGVIKEGNECENNPKYKLEMCDVGTPEQYDWVYDAWGMHVSNEGTGLSFEEFKAIILNNTPKEKTHIDNLWSKENKTLEDWVELKLDPDYKYKSLYPDRKSVLNNLLCTIGTGYDYKNGCIYYSASGADMNIASYGEWRAADLLPKFKKVVDKVLNDVEVALVVDKEKELTLNYKRQRAEETAKHFYRFEELMAEHSNTEVRYTLEELVQQVLDGTLYDRIAKENSERTKELTGNTESEESKARPYYPISNYSNITKINQASHPSYIAGAIEICRDIIANPEADLDQQHHSGRNLEFANQFMEKQFVKDFLLHHQN